MSDARSRVDHGAPGPAGPGAPFVLPGRFRAVVFDLDGVLVDSERAWVDAETALLARHGLAFTEDDASATHGRSLDETADAYSARMGTDSGLVRAELVSLMRARYRAGVPVRPGARQVVLALAARIPLAVASNTDRDLVLLALDGTGLRDAFDTVVTGREVARSKPWPDLYLAACAALAVTPGDAVAFEDSSVGVRAAKTAGLVCVGVPDRDDVDLAAAGADVVIASLEDLVIDLATGG